MSTLLVLYMFPTSYAHLQKDYIVDATLYGMFSMRLCRQATRLKDMLDIEYIIEPRIS